MSWNRASSLPDRGNERIAPRGLWLVAVLAAIVLGGVAVWFLVRQPSGLVDGGGVARARRPIAEAKPRISEEVPASGPHPASSGAKRESEGKPAGRPPQRVGEIRDGFILLSSGELYPVKSVITARCERVSLEDRAFERFSDRLIGSLLTIEPGDGMLGSSEELYKGFDKAFEESLDYPIEIGRDDPEDVKEMKRAVIDIRKELKERKSRGENLERLMVESRNQLMELGTYRDELQGQVEELMADNDFSEKDAEDLVKAANLMLEDRGAKPLDLPVAAIYAIRHMSTETTESK